MNLRSKTQTLLLLLSSMLFFCVSFPTYATAPPPASAVFKLTVKEHDPNTFLLEWRMKPGYFLYHDRINMMKTTEGLIDLARFNLPKAEEKIDGLGHTILVYRNHLRIPVGIVGLQPGEALLTLHYQGCADDGFCYPPQSATIKLTINTQLSLTNASLITPSKLKTKKIIPEKHPEAFINIHFTDHHWVTTLLIFLGLGILLSLTPCVLPMIPVLSGILVGHGKKLSTKKAFFLSLSYVLSMSLTYALIGALVASMGQNLQVILQSPWSISLFSLLFVILALSMFDAYELRLPTSWQAKLANMSYQNATGHYLGAALMGCLSTLILSPCVTAPLIGALAYIAQTGNILLGTAALFFLGLGMGLPLLLIGASLGRWLPHAGHWMNTVKMLFGLMLLAVAIYLMSRLVSPFITMLLWAGLFVFSGLTLGALRAATSSLTRLTRGLGIILLVYGILILIGASLGNTDPLKPLASLTSASSPTEHQAMQVATTLDELEQKLAQAAKNHQPVMLDFYADWCTACKVLESTTLRDPKLREAFDGLLLIKVDLTANHAESRALLHEFNVVAPPTFIFFDASGDERPALRLVGDVSVQDFLTSLHAIGETP
jgi:thioredoxin:protein disulfide reductase